MRKLILFVISLFSLNSYADGILLEPNVGFQFGSHEFSQTGPFGAEARDGTSSGFTLGARVGYKYTMFFGGLDLQYSAPSMVADTATINGVDASNSGQNIALDWSNSFFQLGLSAGAEMPMGIRGWIGYYFLGNLTTDDLYSSEYSGGAFRLGVGYKIIPLVSANFEYVHSSLTADSQEGLSQTFVDTAELTQNAFILSISCPYEFEL